MVGGFDEEGEDEEAEAGKWEEVEVEKERKAIGNNIGRNGLACLVSEAILAELGEM